MKRFDRVTMTCKCDNEARCDRMGLCQQTKLPYQRPPVAEPSEAEKVCAEAYQVVGCLLSHAGLFETEKAGKIMDNLSQARMVHSDVLPWPSVESAAGMVDASALASVCSHHPSKCPHWEDCRARQECVGAPAGVAIPLKGEK